MLCLVGSRGDRLGEKDEGQRLASRSIRIRRGLFGAKGPRVADSMFTVARMLVDAGELLVAARMYRDIIEMSREVAEMRGHLARAMWFLALVEGELNNAAESKKLREEAKEIRGQTQNTEAPDEDTDEAFMAWWNNCYGRFGGLPMVHQFPPAS